VSQEGEIASLNDNAKAEVDIEERVGKGRETQARR
jgi:hypothetical protein